MEISPIAFFRSPFTSKFGVPRQSGVVEEVEGEVVFHKPYDNPDAVRGIEKFDYVWLVWGFSENLRNRQSPCDKENGMAEEDRVASHLLVRPPRLGGNERVGVFASRSPFRPNGLGLSCVRLKEATEGRLIVLGADLMDGTPIYDVKPYVAYADAHPDARSGFVDTTEWQPLAVVFPKELQEGLSEADIRAVSGALSQDPRPHYHKDPSRVYGMPFRGKDIRFRISDNIVEIIDII
ncbi:tRNA (N6-threonylcarbamoyladenosine(37)-N6)-methyltransferase TrmO [Prevotella sp. PINT]|jgi:putative methyltransferase, YaeB/AF_0241 family|nr:tRNA (N6-threonylcarbamoyladenosine(37)-N6)-methyltransferase TrmO [Palleniella intestinalis]NPD81573.1 tRNA (N6-threonylcarbamoyladenosine(37)-N6)-methyltransferase TrmO [Palleniella intestinalis]